MDLVYQKQLSPNIQMLMSFSPISKLETLVQHIQEVSQAQDLLQETAQEVASQHALDSVLHPHQQLSKLVFKTVKRDVVVDQLQHQVAKLVDTTAKWVTALNVDIAMTSQDVIQKPNACLAATQEETLIGAEEATKSETLLRKFSLISFNDD